jgi:cyclohexa-1,5-dienecarbonyl-CoA hydratase
MLPAFSSLVRTLSRVALPSVAAVRGRCLGGGLELALACHRIVAAHDALLGLPEVTLGVFPPVAAAVLPLRVPQPIADRLVVRGEIVDGVEAVSIGLVDDIAPATHVETRALLWAERYAALSGSAVRFATRAVRRHFDHAMEKTLRALEEIYLGELMGTADAREGIAAFLEKRRPEWVDA